MKSYFLHQIEDTSQLQALLKQYPDDAELGQVLLDKQLAQPYGQRYYTLLDTIIDTFQLKYSVWDPVCRLTSVKKEHYKVAVFPPFLSMNLIMKKSNTTSLCSTCIEVSCLPLQEERICRILTF